MPKTAAPGSVLKLLAKGPLAIAKAFERSSPKLRRWKPGKDKWSISEIVVHMLDVEIALSWRLRHVVGDRKPTIIPFDENAWAKEMRYSELDPKIALAAYASLRLANIELARALSPKQLRKKGQHPQYGPISALWLLERYTKHDAIHLAQIERNRAAS